MLDVGCGDGLWLAAGAKLGCADTFGVDGPWTDVANLKIPPSRFVVQDLEKPFDLGRRFDLAISLEVAEHLRPDSSETIVDTATRHADLVLFGAAIPYQGGFRHINEQWPSAWAGRFAERGFGCFDVVRPAVWQHDDVWWWYKQNALLYIRTERADLVAAARRHLDRGGAGGYPLDLVHPEKYLAAASYDQIAFKPLLRRLPGRVLAKSRSMVMRKN